MSAESPPVVDASTIDSDMRERVRRTIARAIRRDPANVPMEASLVEQVGIDSLDLLEIVFELEQEFGVEIGRGALERAARGDLSEEEFAPEGLVSERGLARLRDLLPESRDRIAPGLRPREIVGLFTPTTFARIVAAQRGSAT